MSQPLPFLTDSEILEIVKPLQQPAAIVRWFRDHGYICRVKPNRMPLISRSHFEQVSGCATAANDAHSRTDAPQNAGQPDAAALLARFQKKNNGANSEKQSVRA